jgi:hypothetical protein
VAKGDIVAHRFRRPKHRCGSIGEILKQDDPGLARTPLTGRQEMVADFNPDPSAHIRWHCSSKTLRGASYLADFKRSEVLEIEEN